MKGGDKSGQCVNGIGSMKGGDKSGQWMGQRREETSRVNESGNGRRQVRSMKGGDK